MVFVFSGLLMAAMDRLVARPGKPDKKVG